MISKIQLKRTDGYIIFEYEAEENSVKKTLIAYLNKQWSKGYSKVNLANADLSGADLSGADLSNTDLLCADLKKANLSGANLEDAELKNNNLNRAILNNDKNMQNVVNS